MSKTGSSLVTNKTSTGLPPLGLPPTNVGGLMIGNGNNSYGNLGIGTNTNVLTSNGTTAVWLPPTGGTSGTSVNFTATNGNCTAPSNTISKVTSWIVGVDSATGYSGAPNYCYIIKVAGLYIINASITLQSSIDGYKSQCLLFINNIQSWQGEFSHPPINSEGACNICFTHTFALNDSVDIRVLQTSPISLNVVNQPYCTWTLASLGGAAGGTGGLSNSSYFSAQMGQVAMTSQFDGGLNNPGLLHDWTVQFDSTNSWDGINSEYSIPYTGTYIINASFDVQATLQHFEALLYIYKNGAPVWSSGFDHPAISSVTTVYIAWSSNFTVNDKISIYGEQTSSLNLVSIFSSLSISSLNIGGLIPP